jgi:hypothetical protein
MSLNFDDVNDGKEWSEMDISDLTSELQQGASIEEAAEFLGRRGTMNDVRRKAEELGLIKAAGVVLRNMRSS